MADRRLSDRQLAHDWLTGRRETAAEALYHRHAPSLIGFFRSLRFSDEATSELVQETFLQAFRSLDGFRFGSALKTWLFEIARSVALKRLRYENAGKRQGIEVPIDGNAGASEYDDVPRELVDGNDGPLGHVLASEGCHHLQAAIESLCPEDRRLVRFRLAQELTGSEIAAILRIPVGTVKSRWARIRATLRRKLAAHYSNLPF